MELIALLLFDVALIAVLAHLARAGFTRIRQPAVIGEVIVGICLGPTVVGALSDDLPARLFPADVRDVLTLLADAGLVVFLFGVGLRLNIDRVAPQDRATAVLVSTTSIVLPFALGLMVSGLLYSSYGLVGGSEVDFLAFALFIGVSMSITAFPVLARIVTERQLDGTRVGALVLACAAIDDVVGWSILAVILAMLESEAPLSFMLTLLELVVFATAMIIGVRPFVLEHLVKRWSVSDLRLQGLLLTGAATSAWITNEIGIHLVFGAFLFGAIVPRHSADTLLRELQRRFEPIVLFLLLPIFFVLPGLELNLRSLDGDAFGHLALIIVVATSGKVVGAALPALLRGFAWRPASAIGILMNTRGLMELIVLNIGLTAGVLDETLYGLLVLMALVTTFITGPILTSLRVGNLAQARTGRAHND